MSSVVGTGGSSEIEFHIKSARHGIGAVRRDFIEAQFAVHTDGILHDGLDCVKPETAVCNGTGVVENTLGEGAPQTLPAECRTQVKAFHLADFVIDGMKSGAAGEVGGIARQE